jgi:hypothetical protein
MTLSHKDTPARRRYCRLVARGRRTCDSGSSGGLQGWPTAAATDATSNREAAQSKQDRGSGGINLPTAAELAGWPTPAANEFEPTDIQRMEQRRQEIKEQWINGNGFGLTLGMAAHLSGWATPRASDNDQGPAARAGMEEAGSAWLGQGRGATLSTEAQLTGWATPSATDHKGSSSPGQRVGQLSEQTEQGVPSGPPPSSSPAATARRVVSRLNPGFSLWLMGIPQEWSLFSPFWESWDTIQKLLAELSARPGETEPAG